MKNYLIKAKATRTIYFDSDDDYVNFDSPKQQYWFYKLGEHYTILAKRGQNFYIDYDEEQEKYLAFAKGGGCFVFETLNEVYTFEGFKIIEDRTREKKQ